MHLSVKVNTSCDIFNVDPMTTNIILSSNVDNTVNENLKQFELHGSNTK